jgi:hypothetical protein
MEPFIVEDKLFTLENNPVGLSHMSKTELIVLNDEYCHNKIPYKILLLE